jgi:hypothetical protein
MRKKSKYKPRPVHANSLYWVVSGLQPLTENPEATTLRIKNHESLRSIIGGTGTKEQAGKLIAAMNMTEALMLAGKGADWKCEIIQAQLALADMCERGMATDCFAFTEAEKAAINLGMDIHDAQLDASSVVDIERGIKLVDTVVGKGQARKLTKGTQ